MSNNSNAKKSDGIYISDAPLVDPAHDEFLRWKFSERIAETVASLADPSSIVVGIYGAWGEGKTTVLNFIKGALDDRDDVVCIHFNPWRYADETQLILSFFDTLAAGLKESLPSAKKKVGEILAKYGSMVAPLSVGAGVGVSPGAVVAEIGKRLSAVNLVKLKKQLESILDKHKKRVVVLVDDIDRMDKDEIQAVFRLLKLSADFRYTAYILAFDDEMVSAALQEKYPAGERRRNAGHAFLEKIIQVPLHLPPADDISLRHYCLTGVDKALNLSGIVLSAEDQQLFARHYVDGLEIRLTTPRMAKRYANALSFALPLLKGEVNVVDLMLIEGVRVFYPSLYETIRKKPDVFVSFPDSSYGLVDESEERKKAISESLKEYTESEQERAKSLLKQLFPQLGGIFGGASYGSNWAREWAAKKRIASSEYFPRYMSYAIPEGDISDREIEEFIAGLDGRTREANKEAFAKLVTHRNIEKCIRKLRQHERELSEAQSKSLATALSDSPELFSSAEHFIALSSLSQAAMVTSQLLLNLSSSRDRTAFAKRLVSQCPDLQYAVESFSWMRYSKDQPHEDNTLTEAGTASVGKAVAARIRHEAKMNLLSGKHGNRLPQLLWIWAEYGKVSEVRKYVHDAIAANPKAALTLVRSYLPMSYGLVSGLTGVADLRREHYDALCHDVNPKDVYSALKKLGYKGLDGAKADEFTDTELPVDRRIARQFAAMHNHVKRETAEKRKAKKKESLDDKS